jgi:hypothetical protein
MQSWDFPVKILGIAINRKKLRKTDYLPLIKWMSETLLGWRSNFLSRGGRLILLNSVLTALLTYFMSVFELPKWVIKEMDKIRRNFFWKGITSEQKGYILASWDSIC